MLESSELTKLEQLKKLLLDFYKLRNLDICYDLFRIDILTLENYKFPILQYLNNYEIEASLAYLSKFIEHEDFFNFTKQT